MHLVRRRSGRRAYDVLAGRDVVDVCERSAIGERLSIDCEGGPARSGYPQMTNRRVHCVKQLVRCRVVAHLVIGPTKVFANVATRVDLVMRIFLDDREIPKRVAVASNRQRLRKCQTRTFKFSCVRERSALVESGLRHRVGALCRRRRRESSDDQSCIERKKCAESSVHGVADFPLGFRFECMRFTSELTDAVGADVAVVAGRELSDEDAADGTVRT